MEEKRTSINLDIEGLCCSEEKHLLEKKITALGGVHRCDVNLVSQRLRVDYDPSGVSPQDIIKSVAETGMKALAPERAETDGRAWYREPRIVLLVICGVLTIIGFIGLRLGAPAWIGRLVYSLAIVSGGFYPAKSSLSAARMMSMNINTLLILGVVGAVGLDLWDEAAVLVFVYSLGHVLESFVVHKARGAIKSFVNLMPKEALARRNGDEVIVAAADLRVDDVVIVRPGEKIAVDGVVLSGESYVDESAVTGEPIPRHKATGRDVYAGTINQKGSLTVRVTRTSQDSTLSKIIRLVEEAHAKKSKYQLFGEKFGSIYTPIMFFLGVAVAVVPPLLLNAEWEEWIYRALVVFVVSCSCGLALSIPVAVVAAVGNAARHGILLKGGLYLERASRIEVVAFDKTGTLTVGRPVVTEVLALDGRAAEDLLSIAASIEVLSEHPISEAIVRKAKEAGVFEARPVTGFQATPGGGVRASTGGRDYIIGNARFFERNGVALGDVEPLLRRLDAAALSTVIIGESGRAVGALAIADSIKKESLDTVRELKTLGLRVVMLTGDTERASQSVAAALDVDNCYAGLLPQDKIAAVEALGRGNGRVMMVGDGINDSPAMAVADVGVAMGAAGTDVAMETGDIVLLADDLSRIPQVIKLGRRTVANIRQNIFFSLLVIAVLVPAALVGWVDLLEGLVLNEGGALLVIANGLRLIR